ncbi:MAG TPA: beta-N-acetylglucosaminidase [Lentisphaeria bacterium]|nr:MAG: hypothetical protein A2X45_20660 [Lentisphaerae bacterium GWF2_50_93]HCE44387.1 beta-N-acetylglucosaminidase [Lentisphaeria bacterium]
MKVLKMAPQILNVIPKPQKIEFAEGEFVLSGKTAVSACKELSSAKKFLQEYLEHCTPQKISGDRKCEITLGLEKSLENLGEEGYVLDIQPGKMTIASSSPKGVFYGLQTFRQLLFSSEKGKIPCLKIEDSPRLGWRGMMLDEGRHFFGKEFVKKFIDMLALYKMNSFHWHLTEDQGWRIEIKKYPKLTSVGSKRAESPIEGNRNAGDDKPYEGFYTQDDIREIVKYAGDRFINVVPEIEMPGHAAAAIASYPELGNSDIMDYKPEVKTRWGVHYYTFSPTEKTFKFLEDVIEEVVALFPGRYFHIGGDEAPKDQWKNSPTAQRFILDNGLKDEHELQSYFIKRIETILKKHNRVLIGWDEIQEGGLSPTAAMMVWRDWKWASMALKNGNCIVMAPNSHTYFDHYQEDPKEHKEPEAIGGLLPIDKVYLFNPVIEGITPEEEKRILGAQGQLWSEYLFNTDKVEFMAFPRMFALAEVVWTNPENKNYGDFMTRLKTTLALLDHMKVKYRNPF